MPLRPPAEQSRDHASASDHTSAQFSKTSIIAIIRNPALTLPDVEAKHLSLLPLRQREFFMVIVKDVLEHHRGLGPGFDFVRIALATTIVFAHSQAMITHTYLTDTEDVWQIPVRSLVPMFFALSGFLITGSTLRLRLADFILNRSFRIVPALVVDIIVCACIIGPLFTSLPLSEYISHPEFRSYFLNIFGIIHYTLPGVFSDNPNPNIVNGSLWTVPFEIGCYVIMSLVMVTGLLKRRWKLFILSLIFIVCALALQKLFGRKIASGAAEGDTLLFVVNNFTTYATGYYLYFYFLSGCLFYLFREKIPVSKALFVIALLSFIAISLMPLVVSGLLIAKMLLLIPILSYIVVYIGMTPIPRLPFFSRGDYSYGVYLYGAPIQQSLMALFPGAFTVLTHFLLSYLLTTSLAVFSWHCVEKPVLGLRRKFSFTARKTDGAAAPDLPPAAVRTAREVAAMQARV